MTPQPGTLMGVSYLRNERLHANKIVIMLQSFEIVTRASQGIDKEELSPILNQSRNFVVNRYVFSF